MHAQCCRTADEQDLAHGGRADVAHRRHRQRMPVQRLVAHRVLEAGCPFAAAGQRDHERLPGRTKGAGRPRDEICEVATVLGVAPERRIWSRVIAVTAAGASANRSGRRTTEVVWRFIRFSTLMRLRSLSVVIGAATAAGPSITSAVGRSNETRGRRRCAPGTPQTGAHGPELFRVVGHTFLWQPAEKAPLPTVASASLCDAAHQREKPPCRLTHQSRAADHETLSASVCELPDVITGLCAACVAHRVIR